MSTPRPHALRCVLLLLLPAVLLIALTGHASTASAQSVPANALSASVLPAGDRVRLKDLGKLRGWRDNALVGYGLVSGLAGTGDSPRSQATRQSIANLLQRFDLKVTPEQVNSRNMAAVMITAALPPYARRGDALDVTVTSMGDARSLLGGALLLAPLQGPDGRVYALAQGPISVGGYKVDLNGNLVQKNHPTVGLIPAGALVEVPVSADIAERDEPLVFVLSRPDYTTAARVAAAIDARLGAGSAQATSAADIEVLRRGTRGADLVGLVTTLENLSIEPDRRARVVINERTGVVVAGGDARIARVSISHGDLRIAVLADTPGSQALVVAGLPPLAGATGLAPAARITVDEATPSLFVPAGHNTVADLVAALTRMKTSTLDIIAILQAVKAAGALHADLIIQ